FQSVCGVDFSGAKLAGRNTWIARIEPLSRRRPGFVLTSLSRLEAECGTAERTAALAHLVGLIAGSEGALWALAFPFGFPVEVMPAEAGWREQHDFLAVWGDDGYA